MPLHAIPTSLRHRRPSDESELSASERVVYAVVCVISGAFALVVAAAALLTGPVVVDTAVPHGIVTAAVYGGFGCLAVASGIALYDRRVFGWIGAIVALAAIVVWGLVLAADGAVHGLLTAIALSPALWRLATDRPRVNL